MAIGGVSLGEPWEPDLNTICGRSAPYLVYVLESPEFEAMAMKYGHDSEIGAFAIWGQAWWKRDIIVLRPTTLHLIGHELRHIQEGHFHEDHRG
jgi:hypothetical protein